MNIEPFLGAIVTTLLSGVVGACLVHMFATRRDIALKRREIILPNLIEAMRILEENALNESYESLKKLEGVVNRVQMVGDKELIEICNQMVMDITSTGHSNNTPLYFALRARVRIELKLEPLADSYLALKISPPLGEKADKHYGNKPV